MNLRPACHLLLSLLALPLLACGNDAVCTSAGCAVDGFTFSPTPLVVQATQGITPAAVPVSMTTSASTAIAYSITCDSGITATPASGTIGSSAVQLSVQVPAPPTVGTFLSTCTATSADGSVAGKLSLTLVVSASVGGGSDGGTGPIGIMGGSVDHLYFAVVGDSRPANIDETSTYPTAVITKIYQDLQAMSPQPQFIVTTGDYMYANTDAYTAQPQASLYMQARQAWSGTIFPAMGNHECDGYTADNCTVNQTQNNQAFMSTILAPNQQSLPYYSIPLNATDQSWSAKLVVIACNAWDATQQSWLVQTLAQPTTYTLLVRHEPAVDDTAPCVTPVEGIMLQNPYDLSLVGHTHEFHGNANSKEIVVGNGGAPLDGGTYGYATVERISSGWQIKNFDYSTGLPINTFVIP